MNISITNSTDPIYLYIMFHVHSQSSTLYICMCMYRIQLIVDMLVCIYGERPYALHEKRLSSLIPAF